MKSLKFPSFTFPKEKDREDLEEIQELQVKTATMVQMVNQDNPAQQVTKGQLDAKE